MDNTDRAAAVAESIANFAAEMGLRGEDPETIAGDMISNILHWVAIKADNRETGLIAARYGIAHYVTESGIDYTDPEADEVGPEAYVSISVACDGETWTSGTAAETAIEGKRRTT